MTEYYGRTIPARQRVRVEMYFLVPKNELVFFRPKARACPCDPDRPQHHVLVALRARQIALGNSPCDRQLVHAQKIERHPAPGMQRLGRSLNRCPCPTVMLVVERRRELIRHALEERREVNVGNGRLRRCRRIIAPTLFGRGAHDPTIRQRRRPRSHELYEVSLREFPDFLLRLAQRGLLGGLVTFLTASWKIPIVGKINGSF